MIRENLKRADDHPKNHPKRTGNDYVVRTQAISQQIGYLDDDTARAAAHVVVLLRLGAVCARRSGSSRPPSLLLLIVAPDLADQVRECLVDVNALLGRRLNELAVEVLCEITALIHSHLSLIL